MAFVKEFREFISKGNVMDLAVGVIIGGAFGKIVTSLVNDIIMPPIGYVLNGVDFKNLKYVLKPAVGKTPETAIAYGSFINNVVDFLIIAFIIFLIVKSVNAMKRKEAEAAVVAAAPSNQEVLLAEIRDLLAKK